MLKEIKCHKKHPDKSLTTILIVKYVIIHYYIVIASAHTVMNVMIVNVHCFMQQQGDKKFKEKRVNFK